MKTKLLFLLLLYLCLPNMLFAATNPIKSITMTVGEYVIISPASDCGIYNYIIRTNLYNVDQTAFFCETIKQTNYNPVSRKTYTYYTYKLTALKAGSFTFWGDVNYYPDAYSEYPNYAQVNYTINVVEVKSISIPSNLSLTLGESYTFNPIIADKGAKANLTWTSSNDKVVEVTDGVVTTKSCGTAEITCTASNGVRATCTVKVSTQSMNGCDLNGDGSVDISDVVTLISVILDN